MLLCGLSDIVRAVTGSRLCMSPCVSDREIRNTYRLVITTLSEKFALCSSMRLITKNEDGSYEKTGSGLN